MDYMMDREENQKKLVEDEEKIVDLSLDWEVQD